MSALPPLPTYSDDRIENVARAICKAQGLCKYVGDKCNTGSCTITRETALAALNADSLWTSGKLSKSRNPNRK